MGRLSSWMVWVAGCAALALISSGVAAESIQGSVKARKKTTAKSESESSADDSYYWRVWNGALPEQREAKDLGDVLAVLTGKVLGPPLGCSFDYRGGALEPSTLVGRPGSEIRIANRDSFTHEPAVEGMAGFTPLEVGPGKARVISVPPGGPWRLSDRRYRHVEGYLHSIRGLVACASVMSDGGFRFDDVPPGTYSLRILRGPDEIATRRITVSEGKTVRLDPLTTKKTRRR